MSESETTVPMRYATFIEGPPRLDMFDLTHTVDGLASILVCPWVVVTGESGATYNVMRAIGMEDKNQSLNFGSYRGADTFDTNAPLAVSFADQPVIEDFWHERGPASVAYAGSTFRYECFEDKVSWSEAGGRIKLGVTPLGDVCSLRIPEQSGLPHPFLYRSFFGTVTGEIDSDPVVGLYQLDHIYSRPEINFRESGWADLVHNYWMNWLIEYEDGTREGGHAWQGMPGTDFTAAHHVSNGVSTARPDARMEYHRTERGSIDSLVLELGQDLRVEFQQQGSFDWPIHTYGVAASTSRDKPIKRSWCYMENMPVNWGLVEEYQLVAAKLRGRYPSLQKVLEGSKVVDGRLVFPS
jgi:hypothetical protein